MTSNNNNGTFNEFIDLHPNEEREEVMFVIYNYRNYYVKNGKFMEVPTVRIKPIGIMITVSFTYIVSVVLFLYSANLRQKSKKID